MKAKLFELSERLQRRANHHSRKGNMLRARAYHYISQALLELKWRLA